MEVNYAPSGPSFHGDNVPTEIDLKLTFQELVIFTANDFDEKTGDYVPPGFAPKPAEIPSVPAPGALHPVPPGGFGDNSVAQLQAKVNAEVGADVPRTDPSRKLGTVQLPAFVDPRRPNRP
jgi:hypothetical protein